MSNQLQVIKENVLGKNALYAFKEALPAAAGKEADKIAQRFAQMVYTVVANTPALQKCTPQSLIKSACISASLGLDIDPRGLAYLVPYGNEAQFQIGYQGLIELAFRSGKVKSIAAYAIYDSEKSHTTITRINGRFEVNHPFSYEAVTGQLVAVYATAEVEGFGAQTVVLRADEVEHFRNCSKAKNSPAWNNHYEAMAKKTAIRQLCKFLPKSILQELTLAAAQDEAADFAVTEAKSSASKREMAGSQVIDADWTEPPADWTEPLADWTEQNI